MAGKYGLFVALAMLLIAIEGGAHHSRATFYDLSSTVEIEGLVTRVQWRHPHVRYWIQADAEYGGQEWELETTPPSFLERQGISSDILTAGTRIRVAGAPARVAERAMEASHVLLPDGREVLLHNGLEPRWTDNTVEREILAPFDAQATRAAEAAADSIFRVWSRVFPNPDPLWLELEDYPLTDAARAVANTWDPIADIDTACMGKDMPSIMSTIWPIEFVNEGEQIRLRAEENDRMRIIHLRQPDGDAQSSPQPSPQSSPMGHSVGAWDNESTLVVNTTGISARTLGGMQGIPLSGAAETIERFTLSADERRLDYAITVIDPETFTEPVTLTSFWSWRPGETVKSYNCVETPGSWTEREDKQVLEN